jgi:hypothetical protein
MRKPTLLLLLASGVAFAAPGCMSTMIREGSGAVLGAKGTFMPIVPLAEGAADRPLSGYTQFDLGDFTDEIGGKAPSDFVAYLKDSFPLQARKAGLPDSPSGTALLLRGRIVHYESSSTVGFVLGPLEEVVARCEMVDKATGKVLGAANCIGRTEAAVNSGTKHKAEGLAKALVKWIESGFPEGQKVNKKDHDREREE